MTSQALVFSYSKGNSLIYDYDFHEKLGRALEIYNREISYTSRRLKAHGQTYLAHDLELAALAFTLKIWRYYSCTRKA